MYNDIRLFIEGREVEFSTPPQILYNYNVTDFSNPTIVQNSYSKTITVEGTPANNDLFGHIWRNDRQQSYESGGPAFNPLKRADFLLFVNGELYEKGYARLNGIKRKGQTDITYEIGLFGLFGGFFYSLSTIAGSNRQSTLADLVYKKGTSAAPSLDFEISKDNVNAAWNRLANGGSGDSQWDIINFAVTSEGIPEDFDAGKTLINTFDNPSFTREQNGYKTVLNGLVDDYGYALGELNYELTTDNTFDLRSYLLRPVLNVKRVLEAMKDPDVNGGYELVYDPHFFNSQNPYWQDAWMTLPMLRELKIEKEETEAVSATVSETTGVSGIPGRFFNVNFQAPFGTRVTGFDINITPVFNPTASTTVSDIYPFSDLTINASGGGLQSRVTKLKRSSAVFIQLFAYDAAGNEVARSDAYGFGGQASNADDSMNLMRDYTYRDGSRMHFFTGGHFRRTNGRYVYVDENGNRMGVGFNLGNVKYSTVKFYMESVFSEYIDFTRGGSQARTTRSANTLTLSTYSAATLTGNYSSAQARAYNSLGGKFGILINSTSVSAFDYSSLFSYTKISKDKLLATEYTPADFLLSYMKTFGLYAYSNPAEESSDIVRYPNGVVHIVDRDTFYTDDVIDIHKFIDRGKESSTKPVLADTKYYSFETEPIGSEAQEKYLNTYGHNYGTAIVDTGLEFNNDTTELYDGNVFKSGVMVQEKNRFFSRPVNGVPAYAYGGMKYQLFKSGTDGWETTELNYTRMAITPQAINNSNLDFYDAMPKLQVHTEDLGANEGANVLLFYNGMRSANGVSYFLTDDIEDMATLNDGTPTWILTNGTTDHNGSTIAIRRTQVPYFSRDIVRRGSIIHTWNFGHPRETYTPETVSTNGDCIYDKCWQAYINDIYDVNTRSVSLSARLLGRPNPEWLRRFYWFDNAIWRINSIKDWNISSLDTTKIEFVKVQDIANYALHRIVNYGAITIVLDQSTIGQAGGVITGKVVCQSDDIVWYFKSNFTAVDQLGNETVFDTDDYISPTNGAGLSTNFSVRVDDNQGLTDRTFTISVGTGGADDDWVEATFVQEANTAPLIQFTTTTATVGFDGDTVILPFVSRHMNANTLAVSSTADWVTNSLQSDRVVVYVSPNSGDSRTATITLSGESDRGITLNTTATITQTGTGLSVLPTSLVFDYFDNSDDNISIITEGPWTAEINDE